jgi:hypothetical protein
MKQESFGSRTQRVPEALRPSIENANHHRPIPQSRPRTNGSRVRDEGDLD